jgi:hypothetical protein
MTTKEESSSPIQLKNPAAGDLAQNIEKKRRRCDIDVHNVPFRIDVAIYNECTVHQINMKFIFRIVVAIKECPEPLGFSKLCE